jgi:hypothetical protein
MTPPGAAGRAAQIEMDPCPGDFLAGAPSPHAEQEMEASP